MDSVLIVYYNMQKRETKGRRLICQFELKKINGEVIDYFQFGSLHNRIRN